MAKLTGLNGGAGGKEIPPASEQLSVENTGRMIDFGGKLKRLREYATDYSTDEHDRSALLDVLHGGIDGLLREAELKRLEQRARSQVAALAADEDSVLARHVEHQALDIYQVHGDTTLTARLIGEMTVHTLEDEVSWRVANPTVVLADEQ